MLTRIAVLLTVLAALGQPAYASSASEDAARSNAVSDCFSAQATSRPSGAAAGTAVILPPFADDIRGGRAGRANAAALRQIAADEAIGNRDGAEILRAQLRATGVGRDELRDTVTWAKVHEGQPLSRRHGPVRPDEGAARTMY
jgi:hypothetical protein